MKPRPGTAVSGAAAVPGRVGAGCTVCERTAAVSSVGESRAERAVAGCGRAPSAKFPGSARLRALALGINAQRPPSKGSCGPSARRTLAGSAGLSPRPIFSAVFVLFPPFKVGLRCGGVVAQPMPGSAGRALLARQRASTQAPC